MYKGQPVPSTVYQQARAKVSDGKSVRVVVGENTQLEGGTLVEVGGFLGFLMRDVSTGAGETAEAILNIEQAVFETDKITTAQAFAAGTKVYWDSGTGLLTETATSNRPAGRVTVGKDANNVVWMLLGPQ